MLKIVRFCPFEQISVSLSRLAEGKKPTPRFF
jgi:hypothetical protein